MTRKMLAGATVLASIAATQSGAAAAQSDSFAIRVIGINKLETGRTGVNTAAVACVTPGTNTFVDCTPEGSAVLKVDSATKKKLKLPSATIAKGTIVAKPVPAGGEGEDGGRLEVEASKAVRTKLKKVKRLDVTYRLTLTGPIEETITEKATMVTTTSGLKRLLLRSSGDTFEIAGGGGRG